MTLTNTVLKNNLIIRGINYFKMLILSFVYVGNSDFCSSYAVKFVQDLCLFQLVGFYRRLPTDTLLRKLIITRLCSLNNTEWQGIIYYAQFSASFLEEFAQYIDWSLLSAVRKLTDVDIHRLHTMLDFEVLSVYQCLSEDIIFYFAHRWNWFNIWTYQKLTPAIIIKCVYNTFPRVKLYEQTKLPEKMINKIFNIKNLDKVYVFMFVERFHNLTHCFIVQHCNFLSLHELFEHQKLEQCTIDFLADRLVQETCGGKYTYLWVVLITKQDVSIEFCQTYNMYIDWDLFVKYKYHSEELLFKFKFFLDWRIVLSFQCLTKEFIFSLPSPYKNCSSFINESCSVCLGKLNNAIITNPCNHTFCKICIDICLKYKQKCPICRHGLISVPIDSQIIPCLIVSNGEQ